MSYLLPPLWSYYNIDEEGLSRLFFVFKSIQARPIEHLFHPPGRSRANICLKNVEDYSSTTSRDSISHWWKVFSFHHLTDSSVAARSFDQSEQTPSKNLTLYSISTLLSLPYIYIINRFRQFVNSFLKIFLLGFCCQAPRDSESDSVARTNAIAILVEVRVD